MPRNHQNLAQKRPAHQPRIRRPSPTPPANGPLRQPRKTTREYHKCLMTTSLSSKPPAQPMLVPPPATMTPIKTASSAKSQPPSSTQASCQLAMRPPPDPPNPPTPSPPPSPSPSQCRQMQPAPLPQSARPSTASANTSTAKLPPPKMTQNFNNGPAASCTPSPQMQARHD